jgi:hypothetical protein
VQSIAVVGDWTCFLVGWRLSPRFTLSRLLRSFFRVDGGQLVLFESFSHPSRISSHSLYFPTNPGLGGRCSVGREVHDGNPLNPAGSKPTPAFLKPQFWMFALWGGLFIHQSMVACSVLYGAPDAV